MKKIALIAPISDVYDKAEKIIKEKNYANIDLHLATMRDGALLAKDLAQQGVEIFISRGGTYQLIKKAVSIPVVEIKGSPYDLLESFSKLKDKTKVVGLVGYENLISGIDYILPFIDFNIEIIEVKTISDIKKVIKQYKSRGIEYFIGDSNVTNISRALGSNGILIHSTVKSIADAIEEAQRIYELTGIIRQKAEEMASTVGCAHEGIIVTNKNKIITVFNRAAKKILNITDESVIGKNITAVIPHTQLDEIIHTGKTQLGEIQDVNGIKIFVNRVPIWYDNKVIGAVLTFQKVSDLQHNEYKIRKKLNSTGFVAKYQFEDILYKSSAMATCIHTAKEYAKHDAPVHIYGATGTGKELLCQSIHNASSRADHPFLAVNCSALPPSLIESELFGYAEGSFTGANKKGKPGVFELAHGGTLFLDEITEIPLRFQGRLLRALQEKEIMRVGGEIIVPIDIRIITATNKKLWEEVEKGKFRKDLYYRVNVLELNTPLLKDREGDILLLANYFLRKYSKEYNRTLLKISGSVKKILLTKNYEGNVRELENFMQRSTILGSFDFLYREAAGDSLYKNDDCNLTLQEMGLKHIQEIYIRNNKNIFQTCKELHISRTTLWRKLRLLQNIP